MAFDSKAVEIIAASAQASADAAESEAGGKMASEGLTCVGRLSGVGSPSTDDFPTNSWGFWFDGGRVYVVFNDPDAGLVSVLMA